MNTHYTLLKTNVDGAYNDGVWDDKPTADELLYHIGGMWDDDKEAEIVESLLNNGYAEVNDSACTNYELTEI